jgi:hypothetical protein
MLWLVTPFAGIWREGGICHKVCQCRKATFGCQVVSTPPSSEKPKPKPTPKST